MVNIQDTILLPLVLFIFNILAAVQDITIDGYSITEVEESKLAFMNSLQVHELDW